eukprot:CAMPEP_0197853250 /NCGR_PEP_ID=MMETSP1438-20131217/22389_1 /TAXON_ID=1461541 /ORGANISM="Pterosperma sp., Strain CCMP1384" /LENGTH=329 /DNA_ID=CAMNT_0043467589 /DNA_START=9 /DNA_END=998 /DNA_ORIENTATION=-
MSFFDKLYKKYSPNFPPPEKQKCNEMYRVFQVWDFDHSGYLDFDELKIVLKQLNSSLSDSDAVDAANYALMLADSDHNGKLDPIEFVSLMDQMLGNAPEEVRQQLLNSLLDLVHSVVKNNPNNKNPAKLKKKSKKLFVCWDFDGSGFIEKKELGAVFEATSASVSQEETDEEVSLALKASDANDDGKIEEGEFIALMEFVLSDYPPSLHGKIMDSMIDLVMDRAKEKGPQLYGLSEKLFLAWDYDGSGYLEMSELADVLGQVNDALNEHEANDDAMFALTVADISGDGKIDRQEFIRLMNVMLQDVPPESHKKVMQALLELVNQRRFSC